MKGRLENIATGLVVAAAVCVAAVSVHREFFRSAPKAITAPVTAPTYLKDWRDVIAAGTVIGDSAAPVKIVEFSDLECPGCRLLHSRIGDLPDSLRARFALVFVHFPLPMHRFAMPAARAAECARGENKFAAVIDVLFKKQDSLGLKSWTAFAAEAGIRDTASFSRCTARGDSIPSVLAGRAVGHKLGIVGTPTVIINGWRFGSPPYDSLAALVSRFAVTTALTSAQSR